MASISKVITRQLGKNGPQVPRIGFGALTLTGVYGKASSEEECLSFFDQAFNMGQTFWDTADEYDGSEEVIGKWFAANPDKRKDIFLSTKFGIQAKPVSGLNGLIINSSPEYCHQAIERSLRRLGASYIDIYFVHRLDKVTPIEKTIGALVELKKAGKIRHIGLSECSAASLRRAHAVHPITAVQVEYSAFCLAIEQPQVNLLKTARELGVAVMAYSPLGNGVLTGRVRSKSDVLGEGDSRSVLPWLGDENIDHNVAIIDRLTEMAESKGVSTSQLVLAWLLAQGDDIFPIPGTKSPKRLEENMASTAVTLTTREENEIRELCKGVKGGRVQDFLGFTFGDTPALE